MKKNSFHKSERLKSRKSIEYLFKNGSVVKAFPFVLLYRTVEAQQFPAIMTVAVPKKLIRNATDRNLVKRRTREVYRQLKADLYNTLDSQGKKMELLFLYQARNIEEYQTIEKAIRKLTGKISSLK